MSVASAMEAAPPKRPQPLRRGPDIRAVLRERVKASGRYVDVYVRDRGDDEGPRMAVVAGRRVGPAVRRNRAKRRVRAAVRDCGMPSGRDAVLIARAGAVDAPYEAVRRDVARIHCSTERFGGEHRA